MQNSPSTLKFGSYRLSKEGFYREVIVGQYSRYAAPGNDLLKLSTNHSQIESYTLNALSVAWTATFSAFRVESSIVVTRKIIAGTWVANHNKCLAWKT